MSLVQRVDLGVTERQRVGIGGLGFMRGGRVEKSRVETNDNSFFISQGMFSTGIYVVSQTCSLLTLHVTPLFVPMFKDNGCSDSPRVLDRYS